MEVLRSRASANAKPDKRKLAKEEEEMILKRTADVVGHVNLFEDLEMQQVCTPRYYILLLKLNGTRHRDRVRDRRRKRPRRTTEVFPSRLARRI